jgi:NitT/TauT family transport system substrate-binding protein
MRSPRSRLTALAAVAVVGALGALTACSSSGSSSPAAPAASGASAAGDSAAPVNITFAGPSAPNGIVAQMAYGAKEGIFAKYGINLRVAYPTSGSSSIGPLLVNGTYQMAEIPAATVLADYEQGVKLVSPAGFLQKNALGVTVLKKDHLTTAKDLVGKTFGYPTGTPENLVLDTYLKQNGVDPSSVHTIALSLSALATALISGKISGIVAYPYAYNPNIDSQGFPTSSILFTPAISTMTAVFVVSADWAKANAGILPNLIKAIQESTTDAIKDPATAAKDLVATAPGSAPTAAATQAQWTGTIPYLSTANDTGKPMGWMSSADWAATVAFGEKYLGLKSMDASAVYTNAYFPS